MEIITGPWPNRGDIRFDDYAVIIPYNHLTPQIVRELLDYVTEMGTIEQHDELSEISRLLEG